MTKNTIEELIYKQGKHGKRAITNQEKLVCLEAEYIKLSKETKQLIDDQNTLKKELLGAMHAMWCMCKDNGKDGQLSFNLKTFITMPKTASLQRGECKETNELVFTALHNKKTEE